VTYFPDFEEECYVCGTKPCVVVLGHVQPDTQLCGVCFWGDPEMTDWSLWNDEDDKQAKGDSP
jgi:hypothetical protein